jgi:ParB family chromosome partitioning protein
MPATQTQAAPATPYTGIIKARPSAYNLLDPKAIKRRVGFNPRFDFGEIEELAKSIRVQATEHAVPGGLLQPLRVKRSGDGFELIDGDRRMTAIELLMALAAKGSPDGYSFHEGVPAFTVDKGQDDITSLIQMFESNTGKSFLPLEEAAAYKRMQEAGMTIEQIGKNVQRAHVHIVATLALLDADDSLKEAVKSKKIGGTMAKKIAVGARGDKAKQAELTKEAVEAGSDKKKKRVVLGKVEQVRAAKAAAKGKTIKMRALNDDQLSEMGEKLSKHLIAVMKEAKMSGEQDLAAWVGGEDSLVVAFTFGALQALKAAAGIKINLEL